MARRSLVAALSCGLTLAPLAADAALTTSKTSDRVVVQSAYRTLSATVWSGAIAGPHTHLVWTDVGLHGVLGGVLVDLRWERAHIAGDVNGEPVDVQVVRAENRAMARGTVAGLPVDFVLTPAAIRADYRACTAVLELSGTEYTGFRRCSWIAVPQKVSIQFPAVVAQLDDTQQSALVLALLITGSER